MSGDRDDGQPIPGSWLLKDSWGTEYAFPPAPSNSDAGYLWLPYSGTFIDPALFLGADAANFENIHQYDPLGWTGLYGYDGKDTAWFANIFTGGGSSASAQSRPSSDGVALYGGFPASGGIHRLFNHHGPLDGVFAKTSTRSR